MLLLAMGSVRGNGILLRKTVAPLTCRCLRIAGFVLLGLSFFIQIQAMETPVIAAINWIGILSIEIIIVAIACTVINNIKVNR
ncbi:hypothetical protein B0W47_15705 [Komagataeibacter nataicola]|uniref:Uncharacterized protein n=2 Tax=Komagataeibacter nataicola TaxID=265960 RepID=A0A9N7H222_9PROT|nr:hypothetical protein B0W47_15705 [Komagataeibacter nataicola]PYD66646.1 hypothetical protein CDI09_06830 [Komagataeibacter nataicola]